MKFSALESPMNTMCFGIFIIFVAGQNHENMKDLCENSECSMALSDWSNWHTPG